MQIVNSRYFVRTCTRNVDCEQPVFCLTRALFILSLTIVWQWISVFGEKTFKWLCLPRLTEILVYNVTSARMTESIITLEWTMDHLRQTFICAAPKCGLLIWNDIFFTVEAFIVTGRNVNYVITFVLCLLFFLSICDVFLLKGRIAERPESVRSRFESWYRRTFFLYFFESHI